MKPLHDALESCLSALRSGADLDACLGMYPDLAESLRPALEAAQAAMALASEEIPAAAGIRGRNTLLAKARTLSPSGRRRRMAAQAPRFAFALLAALLAVFLGGGGLLVASAAALPGDPLYGVKRTAEEVRLRLAPSSVRAGLEAIPNHADAVLVLAVDQPRPAGLTRRLRQAHETSDALITVPSFGGRHGHPTIFSRELFPEMQNIREETQGLRAVRRRQQGA